MTPVNDAPSFTKGADQTVNEDAGAQTRHAAGRPRSARGPANESGQTLDFIVTSNDNDALFSAQPAVCADRDADLHARPRTRTARRPSRSRSTDNGGTANGGVDTSAAQTFTITVTAVNDAPSFTKGADQTVLEDAGAQTVTGWATGDQRRPG